MIKLPKEVSRIMKALEEKGYSVYAVGGCVRDSLLGKNPIDFDLATNAEFEEIKAIFPEARTLSEKYSVVRFHCLGQEEEKEDGIIVDLATFRIDGKYTDFRRPDKVTFTQKVEEDLARRDFTINAMADNPSDRLIDLYGGREDLKNRLIKSVGDAQVRFAEDPIRMLRAVRFAAQLNFDLHKSVFNGIQANRHLLEKVSRDAIRGEFEKIIVADHAGKGLKMLATANLMPYIVGEKIAYKMKRHEMDRFAGLTEGIDKTLKVLDRRLGAFYSCFEKKRAEEAIELMNYDNKTVQSLIDGIYLQETLFFMANKYDLKDFLAHYGRERYDYVHNLAKAIRIIYDQPDVKIQNRIHMLKDVEEKNEPVYIEDLAINGDDIINEGIAEGEKVGELLLMLTDVVHRKPKENNREDLLEYARKFKKSKTAAAFRNVHWLK